MNSSLSQSSPSSRPGSTASSIPMTYSMDSDANMNMLPSAMASAAGLQSAAATTGTSVGSAAAATSSLPPAYALHRSEPAVGTSAPAPGGVGVGVGGGGSFATTEDSIDQRSSGGDRSVDYTEDSSAPPSSSLLQNNNSTVKQSTGTGGGGDGAGELDQYYQYQDMMMQHRHHQDSTMMMTTMMIDDSLMNMTGDANRNITAGDATAIIHGMHKKLLHLLSHPEYFRMALDWQAKLDMGIDPSSYDDGDDDDGDGEEMNKNVSSGMTNFEKEFDDDEEEEEEDSTFKGLTEDDNTAANDTTTLTNENNIAITHSENETFEFHQVDTSNATTNTKPPFGKASVPPKRKEAPLPHQIFASDAEVVLPQALTASQLFGIERVIGIELEAAAGITGLSQLFLRWLALMPEGDHVNPIDPPGLTVMKIAGGGYRVTAAHRVVWRWMNKFSPTSTILRDPNTGKFTNEAVDFDFGDLVTMTIIDVFETDVNGKLLSYCPTFDNRAVHKTPEMAERIRKGASHLMERVEDVVNSPAGKSVNQAAERLGKMSFRAAIVVGNAVKNKIQHKVDGNRVGVSSNEEDALDELMTSQIAGGDETLDINATYSSALDEDPMSSPSRRMEV